MSLLTALKKNLSEEQYNAVRDALGDDFDYDVVPRTRLNKVIKQRNEYKDQLEHPKDAPDNIDDDDDDEDGIDGGGKKPAEKKKTDDGSKKKVTVDDLEAAKKAAAEEAVAGLKLEYAIKNKLAEVKAKDVDLVAGLLDTTKITFDDKGALTGLDEQITTLTKDKAFLFGTDKDAIGGTGKGGSGSGSGEPDKLDAELGNVFANFGITPAEE